MPTALTHAVVAGAAGRIAFARRLPVKFWLLAVLCSAGPDLDVGLHRLGVRYADVWGHRGMTHSLFFAALGAVVVVILFFRKEAPFLSRSWWSFVLFFFALTASHGLLDAFTRGGLGIAFFSPFDQTRYFMPWRPLKVSPFGIRFLFTEYGLRVIASEVVLVWLPCLATAGVVTGLRAWRGAGRSGDDT